MKTTDPTITATLKAEAKLAKQKAALKKRQDKMRDFDDYMSKRRA